MNKFGQVIKARRRKLGIRQVPLARKCGVTQGTISKIERGQVPPSFDFAVRVSRALDIRLEKLAKAAG